MKLNIDWSEHPLGLVPDSTIAEAVGCTPAGVKSARDKALIHRTTIGCGRAFPWWPGAWLAWVDAWGAERVRAYVAAHLPGLAETFERDLPRIHDPKPEKPRKRYPRKPRPAPEKSALSRTTPPPKTVEQIAEARMRNLARAREAVAMQQQARAAEAVATASVSAPAPAKQLRIPEGDARRFVMSHGDPESAAQRAAHRRMLEGAWARYVAEGGKVTVGAPAGSGSVTGAVIAVASAPERFREVSRVD